MSPPLLLERSVFLLAVLGLCCCMQAFSSCSDGGYSTEARVLLIEVAFLVAEHGLVCTGSVVVAHGIFPDRGRNPRSPALEGGFLSTVQPGKSFDLFILFFDLYSSLG